MSWKIFSYLDRRHGLAPIGALGSQARRTRSLWPATRVSTRSPVASGKYELPPVKADRRDIEARVWSLVHDHPTLKASLSRSGGAYEIATFKKLEGRPNWTMEWSTDDQLAKAAFERIVRSVQTQIELD